MKFVNLKKFVQPTKTWTNGWIWNYTSSMPTMKFVEYLKYTRIELEADNGTTYATNENGSGWERLYGQSWETVWGDEEDRCKLAFKEYRFNEL
jgi:hypothetical protein